VSVNKLKSHRVPGESEKALNEGRLRCHASWPVKCHCWAGAWKGWVTSKEEWWSGRKGVQSLLTQIDGSCLWNADHNGRSRTRGVSSNSIHPYLCTPEHSEHPRAFGRVPGNAEIRKLPRESCFCHPCCFRSSELVRPEKACAISILGFHRRVRPGG
jgi:hypothetical protein